MLGMGVLQKRCEFEGEMSGTLTTSFVYDWRLKTYAGDNSLVKAETKRWMRRSRYVAREFANDKRDDVYSPATGCHTSNLVPIVFLQMLKQLESSELDKEKHDVVLAALDIKDALMPSCKCPSNMWSQRTYMELNTLCCATFLVKDLVQKHGTGISENM